MNVVREEDGQTALEYVLIVAVLILVVIAAVPPLREGVTTVITGAQNKLVLPVD